MQNYPANWGLSIVKYLSVAVHILLNFLPFNRAQPGLRTCPVEAQAKKQHNGRAACKLGLVVELHPRIYPNSASGMGVNLYQDSCASISPDKPPVSAIAGAHDSTNASSIAAHFLKYILHSSLTRTSSYL